MHHSSWTLGSFIRSTLITILLFVFIGYVLWQSRLLLGGPELTLTSLPSEITSKPYVTLEGVAKNIVAITINDRPIMTSEKGQFKEDIILPPGYTIVSIEARDRYGRTKQLEQSFVYTPVTITTTNES